MLNQVESTTGRTDSQSKPRVARRADRANGTPRWTVLILFFALALALISLTGTEPTSAATDKLPDLGMATFKNIYIEVPSSGIRWLRFAARIVNVGSGAFEARGTRPSTQTSTMTVAQRIYDTGGGYRDVSTPSTMFFAGDGHNHWHIKDLQTYELIRLDNGVKVGTSSKSGFCFFDGFSYNLSLPGAPANPVYTKDGDPRACAKGRPDALEAVMGLSVGWGDRYGVDLPDQYIDITGLTAGQYRLQGTADQTHWYLEQNETNNCTWTDLQITGSGTGLNILGNSGDLASCNGSTPSTPTPTRTATSTPVVGTTSTPSPTPTLPPGGSTNLLVNPGFELDADNNTRPDNWTSTSYFSRSSELVHGGSFAGKHSATTDATYTVNQVVSGVTAGATYHFSGWVNVPPTGDAFSFALDVRWRDAAGNNLRTDLIKTYAGATGGWNQATGSWTAPANAASAVVRMRVTGLNATLFVDDFSFGP